WPAAVLGVFSVSLLQARMAADEPAAPTSYDQVSPLLQGHGTFEAMMAKDKADKAKILARHKALLDERYNLTAKTDPSAKMSRGKPLAVGPTAKLPDGMTWDQLAGMTPDEVKSKKAFPKGYLPLPHPNHAAGGMLFPQMEIKQQARLERFDLDFD